MKTININIYKFSELSDLAKENARKLHYENEDYSYLSSDIAEEMKMYIEDKEYFWHACKIDDLKYSLSYSQGDGLSFNSTFDFDKCIDTLDIKTSQKNALKKVILDVRSANMGRYCFASNRDVLLEISRNSTVNILDLAFDTVLKTAKEQYIDICSHLEKFGYSIIEYRMSDEEFSDFSDGNDYDYYEDGRMY